jgi:ubiquinone/menaquinone biosynthesis C-methylase UbiE
MDATQLEFADGTFDQTLCVATFHHLDDAQALAAIRESWRVVRSGGSVHIIDPVIPSSSGAWLKRGVFANDRGRFQRTELQIRTLAAQVGSIAAAERVTGRLHDVLYLRLDKS